MEPDAKLTFLAWESNKIRVPLNNLGVREKSGIGIRVQVTHFTSSVRPERSKERLSNTK